MISRSGGTGRLLRVSSSVAAGRRRLRAGSYPSDGDIGLVVLSSSSVSAISSSSPFSTSSASFIPAASSRPAPSSSSSPPPSTLSSPPSSSPPSPPSSSPPSSSPPPPPPRSWSPTLCLPRSTFPARPDPAAQVDYLRRCTTDLYAWQQTSRRNSPLFTLHDGPPYANGRLHVGHALNKILKDVTLRVALARGKRVEYVPGWDCHGLPIELKALQGRKGGGSEGGKEGGKGRGKEGGKEGVSKGKPWLGEAEQKEVGQKTRSSASPEEYDPVAVRTLARNLAAQTVEEQRAAFRQWAVLGDWDNAWTTMQPDFELRQLQVFRRMLAKGLIYRGRKPVYWSPSSRTALAEGELEYRDDHASTAAFARFEAVHQDRMAGMFGMKDGDVTMDKKISFLIWTTTPWTLPANRAIVVRNDMPYVCAHFAGIGYLIVAESRLGEVEKQCKLEHSGPIYGPVDGSQLVGMAYRGDFFTTNQICPVLHGDYVQAASGTGLVHSAPGHGMDDYKLGLQHGIAPFTPVDDLGRYTADAFSADSPAADLIGKPVQGEGNIGILKLLKSAGPADSMQIIKSHKYTHSYPYDWRSKQPVIIRATAQWFADLSEIRDLTAAAIEDVEFVPSVGKQRLLSTVRARTEWCISRQRAWGVPIPALYRRDNGEALLTPESVSHVISVIRERGIDAWWTDAENDEAWIPPDARGVDGVEYVRGKDTMDVWFDSGTSWTHMGRDGDDNQTSPTADVYLEGSDQHRGWFQSSILTKIAHDWACGRPTEAPFRKLITHGFTLDGKGRKMSKSEGNIVSPDEIIAGTLLPPVKRRGGAAQGSVAVHDSLGPDMLRLLVASSDYTRDVQIGRETLRGLHQSLAKLRVTFRLLVGLLEDFDLNDARSTGWRVADLGLANRIALVHLQAATRRVWRAYTGHEYHRAAAALAEYVNADFSALYNEAVRDRMYADAAAGPRRRAAQFVLWHVYEELAAMLRPLTPLLVEEADAHMPKSLRRDPAAGLLPPRRLFHPADVESDRGGDGDNDNGLVLRLAGLDQTTTGGDTVNGTTDSDPGSLAVLRDRVLPVVLELNAAVKAMLEVLRAEKRLGSSLQAHVTLRAIDSDSRPPSPPAGAAPTANGARALALIRAADPAGHLDELADIFVVSGVSVEEGGEACAGDSGAGEACAGDSMAGSTGDLTSDSTGNSATTPSDGFALSRTLDAGPAAGIRVSVYESARLHKCPRCWRHAAEAAEAVEAAEDALCSRCARVVAELDAE